MRSLMMSADDGTLLHVGTTGHGPDVVVLSGGPGYIHYLAADDLAPRGLRAWYPEPRGVGRSRGGPHDLARAVADLEVVRRKIGVESWAVVGHSWGSDLAVRYALDHPDRVRSVVGVAGHGLHKDSTWSQVYESSRHLEADLEIPWEQGVHAALSASFVQWIHEPDLWRRLADCPVVMTFIAAQNDIRPSWPLRQLAALIPGGRFEELPAVGHNLWATDPELWVDVVTRAVGEDR
ncbi:alpha/beta fold hydrolase [Nocardia sp. CDC159]|uniref:Alpha/beta fold hydrolase n=1 Tax=Nocardia pulmonis TaxID=2951408 RepID=A0A9X2E7B4_9NOCA|nr:MULTISPECIES: alpha/beta hydrolase [Nocardia]MCM6774951.1 alpha/beta fold hydrolase [Nocardia pulmonis]MCM6789882.1 alpha/beta fold hydrolase [Nocardia sp. CDC159]